MMIVLAWYSAILISVSFLINIVQYTNGIAFLSGMLLIPVVIYLWILIAGLLRKEGI